MLTIAVTITTTIKGTAAIWLWIERCEEKNEKKKNWNVWCQHSYGDVTYTNTLPDVIETKIRMCCVWYIQYECIGACIW